MRLTRPTTAGQHPGLPEGGVAARPPVAAVGVAELHEEPVPPSPWLSAPGAVAGEGDEAIAPAHYGRPVQEQRALESGRAVTDLGPWQVLSVSGSDRLTWLHSLTSQHLSGLQPGQCTEALVLDPQGRVEHAMAVVDDGERTWLITEPPAEGKDSLARFLVSMRFAMRVEVELHPQMAVLGALRPLREEPAADAASVLADFAAAPAWTDPWPVTAEGSTHYGCADVLHPGSAHQAIWQPVLRERLAEVREAMDAQGLVAAGLLAWEARRVAAWRPRRSRDVDAKALPHELDWLRTAVHLSKGCYRGQETVARVVNLGRPPRRLVQLHLDGSEDRLPTSGCAAVLGEREVGVVTSVARHGEDGPLALALVRRAIDARATLHVEGIAAAQECAVCTSGEPAERPAQPDRSGLRRRDLR